MKKSLTLLLFIITSIFSVKAQVKSPDEFLGYALGTHFTPHYKVAEYFRQVAAAAPKSMKLIAYGMTNEGRPLMVAVISSAENIARIEEIKKKQFKAGIRHC